MDIAELAQWLKISTWANVVVIDDARNEWVYNKIPLHGSVTMKNETPVINTSAPSTCEALVFSPSFGLLLVRSTQAVVGHGGKQRSRTAYFAELYGEARTHDVKKIVENLQGSKTIRVTMEDMKSHHLSVIIGFAPDQTRYERSDIQLRLPMPWTP